MSAWVRRGRAAVSLLPSLGILALMAIAIAIDVASGREDEWPSL